jgi:glycosyltransferase involved in cell wall biosynthesis
MKVALVYDVIYPFSKGGVEKRVRDVARGLSERGHSIDVYGTKEWDGLDDLVSGNVALRGIACPYPLYTKRGSRSIRQAVVFALRLGRRLSRERYDVVDVQNMAPLTCIASLVAARIAGSAVLVTWHEVWREYWNQYIGWRGYFGRLAEWMIIKMARHHAAVSESTRRQLEELGVDSVGLLPNGIDLAAIRLADPSSLTCDLVYVGRLIQHKNVDLLVDAVSVLKRDGLDPMVVVVGDGPLRAGLQQKAASNGLENISFLGSIDEEQKIYSILKSARMFVLPSTREGFGLAALEAAGAGLPVATIDHPANGALDLIVGHEFGLASRPTPSDFAAIIREILEDGQLRRTLGVNAYEAAAEYDWSRVIPTVERSYSHLLKDNPQVSTS